MLTPRQIAVTLNWVATGAQLLPVIPVLRGWRAAEDVRKWVAIWCVVFFVSDLLQIQAARLWGPNAWLFKFTNPVEDGLILYAFSFWQPKPVGRIAFRVAIPLVLLSYLVIAFAFNETESYQVFAGPFRGLVVLAASVTTLIVRLARETEGALSRDWLWTTLGVSMYYAMMTAFEPIMAGVAPAGNDALFAVFAIKAVVDTIAFILIWKGMRCLRQTASSGPT